MRSLRIVLAVVMVAATLGASPLAATSASTYRPDLRWPAPTWHLSSPSGVAVDAAGNAYVADTDNNCIRKYNAARVLVGVWGSLGNADGQFNKPMDVALDGAGHVYVADTGNHRVQKLTTSGTFVARWGAEGGPDLSGYGDGEFDDPRGIGVDGAGNVYVADTGNSRVQKFTASGTFVGKWGYPGSTEGQFYYPEGIAVETSGTVFVADSGNYRIQEFGPDGTFVNAWGEEGSAYAEGKFRGPRGVAVDNSGHVYVSDSKGTTTARILKYSRSGVYLALIADRGTGDGQLIRPLGLACDTVGNVWAADSRNDRIQWFSSEGTLGQVLGSWGTSSGRFQDPADVAVGPFGDVYIADTENDRVQRFSATGAYLGDWRGGPLTEEWFREPVAVAVDPGGNVFVVDRARCYVQKFTRDGSTQITKWGAPGTGNGYFDKPSGIAIDGAGNVYVADTGNNRIQKFDNTGVFLMSWGARGEDTGSFSDPEDVAVTNAGDVYVADTGNARVQRFSSTGEFVTAWGSAGQGEGQFVALRGIAVVPNGSRVFASDSETSRIQAFSAAGQYLTEFGARGPEEGQLASPVGIAFAAPDLVYVADTANHRVQRFVEYTPVGIEIRGVTDGAAYTDAVTPEVRFTGAALQSSSIRLNGTLWVPQLLDEEAAYVLRVEATDIYDYHVSETVSFFIDRTPPSVSDNAQDTYEGLARITLTASDSLSGVASITYELNDRAPVVVAGETALVEVATLGEHELVYSAVDNAGNASTAGSTTFTVLPGAEGPVINVAGGDRYETAVEASKLAYPDGADVVVIATGRNWPDALGGSALAGVLDGPILLVTQASVPEVVAREIERLRATRAVIVGGEVAVGAPVAGALAGSGLAVERVAGGSRYETADAVALRVIEERGAGFDGTAFVATGGAYADAVAAAPLAAAEGWPLYLAHPSSGLSTATRQAMADVTSVVVLGGELAVSASVEAALASQLGADGVTRLAGSSRYGTAAAVAAHGVEAANLSWNRVGIATGQAYPDALAGGVLQGKVRSVMLLTRSSSLSDEAGAALSSNKEGIHTVTYFGGNLAIGQAVRDAVAQALQ